MRWRGDDSSGVEAKDTQGLWKPLWLAGPGAQKLHRLLNSSQQFKDNHICRGWKSLQFLPLSFQHKPSLGVFPCPSG